MEGRVNESARRLDIRGVDSDAPVAASRGKFANDLAWFSEQVAVLKEKDWLML